VAHPNQYTKPTPGQVVQLNDKCPKCHRRMVANYMGENKWCPYCKASEAKQTNIADQIATAWNR
jgi:hypothetical protein